MARRCASAASSKENAESDVARRLCGADRGATRSMAAKPPPASSIEGARPFRVADASSSAESSGSSSIHGHVESEQRACAAALNALKPSASSQRDPQTPLRETGGTTTTPGKHGGRTPMTPGVAATPARPGPAPQPRRVRANAQPARGAAVAR